MSVNNLIKYADSLLDRAEFWENVNITLPGEVDDLEDEIHVLKNAWHPVSGPPTEEDGDAHGDVLIIDVYGEPRMTNWTNVGMYAGTNIVRHWARTRDVVLLPF